MSNEIVLEMKGICKRFPGVIALDSVNLQVKKGSIHGLVGENGAGKSTLMKVLTGTYIQDEGDVLYKGQVQHFKCEKDSLSIGISIVPQELNYVPGLTVEENIYLGREQMNGIFLNKKERNRLAKEVIDSMNLNINPKAKMSELNIAQCQMIEIVKAISRGAELIVFDEPTSSLTSVETENLISQIFKLRDKGVACIYISHKLDEILTLCDDISVLRDAHYIGSMTREEATEDKIIAMMVGREMGKLYPQTGSCSNEEVLRVENFTRNGVFEDVSFTLRKGEVLGFAGMVGAGRSEVMRALFGIDPHTSGKIYIDGKETKIKNPANAINSGICMVFEDRRTFGFVGGMSVKENIVLPNAKKFSGITGLNFKAMKDVAEDQKEKLNIKTPNVEQKVVNLSGGNQQKVVLAKWMLRKDLKVLIMDEPTRGIDVGAKLEIYEIIKEMASKGISVIIISSEMPEVINVSQSILVMREGRIVGEMMHADATQEKIMATIVNGGQ